MYLTYTSLKGGGSSKQHNPLIFSLVFFTGAKSNTNKFYEINFFVIYISLNINYRIYM